MKFLVDMPLSPLLSAWLRSEGHDALHANDLAMNRSPDTDLLTLAAREGRVLVTADLDFPRLLAGLKATGPGLILLRNGNYSEAEGRACVERVLRMVPARNLEDSIVVVDKERIRRRRLPVGE